MRVVRYAVAAVFAVAVVLTAAFGTNGLGGHDLLPPLLLSAVAIAALVDWPRGRRWLPAAVAAAAVASLIATATYRPAETATAPVWVLLEPALLMALVFALVRWGRSRWAFAAATLAGIALGALILRYLSDDGWPLWERVAACAFWAMGAVAAAAVGSYLRWLAQRRAREVADARRTQRLDLARDLHDFVAHDVSEIVAQAQAARWIGGATDLPEPLSRSLERIEQAGQRALGSIDRTVHMLHEPDGTRTAGARTPTPGLDGVRELVERYAASTPAEVNLELDAAVGELPREVAATLHRIASEGLTNIRRHAPGATRVTVRLDPSEFGVRFAIANDTAPGELSVDVLLDGAGRPGGLGLPGLAERVEVLGGTLTAGPHGPGWCLTAELPTRPPIREQV